MGRFAGLGGVQVNAKSIFFLDGLYRVKILEVLYKRTMKGDTFIINTEVLESSRPERPPGCRVSQVECCPKFPVIALQNFKQFVAAVLGIEDSNAYFAEPKFVQVRHPADPSQLVTVLESAEQANDRFWSDAFELLVSDEQPAAGLIMDLIARDRHREGKTTITDHIWAPLRDAI
jgi:hypothetical protein